MEEEGIILHKTWLKPSYESVWNNFSPFHEFMRQVAHVHDLARKIMDYCLGKVFGNTQPSRTIRWEHNRLYVTYHCCWLMGSLSRVQEGIVHHSTDGRLFVYLARWEIYYHFIVCVCFSCLFRTIFRLFTVDRGAATRAANENVQTGSCPDIL